MNKRAVGSMLLGLWVAGSLAARAGTPFGHADWQPSPTDPVGFAGQGNNWYPGATPPLEWSDTTNAPAQNIRWKVPIPGWTDAQPIVVGKRVIGVYSPHHVVCYDADTGKVLWQDELKLMELPVLQNDGRTILPVLDPVKAQKQQLLFERAAAELRIHGATGLGYSGGNTANVLAKVAVERRVLIEYVAETLEAWKKDLASDWPDLVPALEQDIAFYRQALDPSAHKQLLERTELLRRGAGNFPAWVKRNLPQVMSIGTGWSGSISDVMAAPVSDGEVVCVTMGYGQIAGYEVATGKRLWAWRHPTMNPSGANHCASPLLWKDLLLIPAPSLVFDRKATTRAWNQQSLMAIDKRTGAIRWERPDNATRGDETAWGKQIGFHGIHESPHLMRYPLGNGQVRALVIGNTGNIVDAETGVSLGQLRGHFDVAEAGRGAAPIKVKSSGHGFTAAWGDRVYRGTAEDNFSPSIYITELKLTPSNTVEQIPGPATDLKSFQGPFALSDKLLALGQVVDPQTGATLANLGRAASATIAGSHLLLADSHGGGTGPKKHEGGDLLALPVQVFDISDPTKPKLVRTNLIQARGYTPDISGKYFPKFAADPALRRWGALVPGHVNYQGIGFNFATDTAGLTAHGNRLYLHSPSWLYCIGEQ